MTYFDPDYVQHMALIQETLPKCNIINMKRIQTPHLYIAYQNKKNLLIKRGNAFEKLLFHGINKSDVEAVYENNIDCNPRRSNIANRQYGCGAYFTVR